MGHVPKLLTFDQAAKELNVLVMALKTAADHHDKTVRIGRGFFFWCCAQIDYIFWIYQRENSSGFPRSHVVIWPPNEPD